MKIGNLFVWLLVFLVMSSFESDGIFGLIGGVLAEGVKGGLNEQLEKTKKTVDENNVEVPQSNIRLGQLQISIDIVANAGQLNNSLLRVIDISNNQGTTKQPKETKVEETNEHVKKLDTQLKILDKGASCTFNSQISFKGITKGQNQVDSGSQVQVPADNSCPGDSVVFIHEGWAGCVVVDNDQISHHPNNEDIQAAADYPLACVNGILTGIISSSSTKRDGSTCGKALLRDVTELKCSELSYSCNQTEFACTGTTGASCTVSIFGVSETVTHGQGLSADIPADTVNCTTDGIILRQADRGNGSGCTVADDDSGSPSNLGNEDIQVNQPISFLCCNGVLTASLSSASTDRKNGHGSMIRLSDVTDVECGDTCCD